jgi:LacI family transcriptional regulator
MRPAEDPPHGGNPGRPTMATVAKLAGVSVSTVSLVLSDRKNARIPERTRDKVRAAAAKLSYRPNRAARGLRLQRTNVMGMVTDVIASTPFGGATVAGATEEAWQRGYLLVVVNTSRDPDILGTAIETLIDYQVDSMMYAAEDTSHVAFPSVMSRLPSILVNCFTTGQSLPVVLPDDQRGGESATTLLLDEGHRRIAYLTGQRVSWATQQRFLGYRRALRRAGVPFDPNLVLEGNYRMDSGYELAKRLLRDTPLPTAIMTGNDRMAGGAYFALVEAGVRIPEDISVVGYDDQESFAADLRPALTTIRLPHYEMGRLAARHLLDVDTDAMPENTLVRCPLVIRDSVAAVPGSGGRVRGGGPRRE